MIVMVHQVGETVNVDYFSVDGVSDHELHLDEVVKQREELQHLEVNLKARLIARSEVTGIHERFDSQIKEHITSNVKLQEQLHEREKTIMDLQRTLDDKDKELHAIRLDHEVAWAKEDLIREQQKKRNWQLFENVIILKLKGLNILKKSMNYKNMFKKRRGSSRNCRNRYPFSYSFVI
ncbi:hypothetical protein HanRHA438_Chr06g0255251 [Helianthus annuus]|uniref:Uncharacterized protein n=1 Tax=Helianthus annuus TaxID=4232 RepID=A0A9K3IR17_HELAN|nr:hypothetical protein HanXRQr2_Chr06g0246061 [Helianthus annuus]KAJ0910707.1 hypothetical protein HanRHA438_Chr06g0255251 [Helianthus annuus]